MTHRRDVGEDGRGAEIVERRLFRVAGGGGDQRMQLCKDPKPGALPERDEPHADRDEIRDAGIEISGKRGVKRNAVRQRP